MSPLEGTREVCLPASPASVLPRACCQPPTPSSSLSRPPLHLSCFTSPTTGSLAPWPQNISVSLSCSRSPRPCPSQPGAPWPSHVNLLPLEVSIPQEGHGRLSPESPDAVPMYGGSKIVGGKAGYHPFAFSSLFPLLSWMPFLNPSSLPPCTLLPSFLLAWVAHSPLGLSGLCVPNSVDRPAGTHDPCVSSPPAEAS